MDVPGGSRRATAGRSAGQSAGRRPTVLGVPHLQTVSGSFPGRPDELRSEAEKAFWDRARSPIRPGRQADQRRLARPRSSKAIEAEIDAKWLDAVSFAVGGSGTHPDHPANSTRYTGTED